MHIWFSWRFLIILYDGFCTALFKITKKFRYKYFVCFQNRFIFMFFFLSLFVVLHLKSRLCKETIRIKSRWKLYGPKPRMKIQHYHFISFNDLEIEWTVGIIHLEWDELYLRWVSLVNKWHNKKTFAFHSIEILFKESTCVYWIKRSRIIHGTNKKLYKWDVKLNWIYGYFPSVEFIWELNWNFFFPFGP